MLAYLPLVLALQTSDDTRDYQKYYDEDRAAAVSAPLLHSCFGRPGAPMCIDKAFKVCIGSLRTATGYEHLCERPASDRPQVEPSARIERFGSLGLHRLGAAKAGSLRADVVLHARRQRLPGGC